MEKAVFFLTHVFGSNEEFFFNKLLSDLRNTADVFIFTWNPEVIPQKYKNLLIIFDNEDILPGRNRWFLDFDMDIARIFFSSIFRKKKLSFKYKYYWFIEYDVWYEGDWRDIIDISDNSDLLATHISTLKNHIYADKWRWWSHPSGKHTIYDLELIKAYLPIYRISHQGLAYLQKAVSHKWRWHFELVIPTAINFYWWLISEIWGEGEFTPEHRKKLFYQYYPTWLMDFLWNFRCIPHVFHFFRKNKLYHPRKHIFSRIKSIKFLPKRIYLFISYYTTL